MVITFRQLEIFVVAARLSSVTKAAEKLFLTQAAVSMSISEMERLLDNRLFDRVGRKVLLNEYGRGIFPRAVELIKRLGDFENFIEKKEKVFGHLKLGATITIGNYVLPPMLAKFMKAYPEVKIEMKIANTKTICNMVDKYEIDVAFIEGSCTAKEVDKLQWLKDRLVIFASKDHPLAKKNEISVEDLKNIGWVLREKGSGTREYFEKAIISKINIIAEIGDNEAIKNVVKTGMGISCLSYESIKSDVELNTIRILNTPWLKIRRDFLILTNCCKYKTILLETFLKYALNYASTISNKDF